MKISKLVSNYFSRLKPVLNLSALADSMFKDFPGDFEMPVFNTEFRLIVAESPEDFDALCAKAYEEGFSSSGHIQMAIAVVGNDALIVDVPITKYAQQWIKRTEILKTEK